MSDQPYREETAPAEPLASPEIPEDDATTASQAHAADAPAVAPATEAAAEAAAEAPVEPVPAETVEAAAEAAAESPGEVVPPETVEAAAEAAAEAPGEAPAEPVPAEPVEAAAGAAAEAPVEVAQPETVEAAAEAAAEAPADVAPEAPAESTERSDATPGGATETAAEVPAAPTPTPTPAPGPRPTPGSRPTPRALPKPAVAASAAAPVVPQPALDPALSAAAAQFGRVDEDGNVFVKDGETERIVGQFPGGTEEEALSMYVRRYLDLAAQVALLETRLPHITPKEAGQTQRRLTEQLTEPAAVGDLPALRERLIAVEAVIEVEREKARVERAEAKAAALVERTALIERAEAIAEQNPANIRWKSAGEEMRSILDSWKDAQRKGPRLDKPDEDGLWKRYSAARTRFDKQRRAFFQQLDQNQEGVRRVKERLITRAEELSGSTDWGPTSGAYRDLMDQWKAAGRASKKVDDELWHRFRTAQQRFFDNRTAANEAIDKEYGANLEVKLEILEEAEALLPIRDVEAAKAALRPLQDRWEDAGKVPRADIQRVEGRMRAVEKAVRDADQAKWQATDPEKKARADGMLAQLEDAISALEADLRAAQAGGDAAAITAAQEALDARRAWLEQIQAAQR